EQAHLHLRELGARDARTRTLGERAARYLAAAGRRALARDDVSPAAHLLGRALTVLDASDLTRGDLLLDWCEALLAAGDIVHAKAAIEDLSSHISLTTNNPTTNNLTTNNLTTNNLVPRLAAWHTCFAAQLAVLTDPQALRATINALAAAAPTLA